VLATELVHRSQGEPQRCWELLQELRQHYEQGTLALSIWTTPQGTRHLSALPLTHCPGTIESFASAQDAVAAFYGPYIDATALTHLRHTVQKTVRQTGGLPALPTLWHPAGSAACATWGNECYRGGLLQSRPGHSDHSS
jgi:hypothetical protein